MGDALCDLVITDGVDVTTVCRLGRSVPEALKTAIAERDQRCVVPGCGVALGLERDHWQVDFAKGGVASMDNLARLCTHHHQLKTHHGFALTG
ncbi:MAG TPA: HNH endonuclease signature motif containing protein, partial [Acidimicrobiales bacterium]